MKKHFSLLFTAVLLCCSFSLAQVSAGTPNFSAYDSHGVDSVNLMNNNILFNTPVMQKNGSMPFGYSISGNYAESVNVSTSTWQLLGPRLTGVPNNTTLGTTTSTSSTQTCQIGSGSTTKSTHFVLSDKYGTSHALPLSDFTDRKSDGTSCLTGSGFTDVTTDNSGWTATFAANGLGPSSVYTSNGNLINANSNTDANGNEVSLSSGVWTDSMGLTVLTVGSGTYPSYTWADISGGSPAVTYTTSSTVHLKSNFACTSPAITDYDTTGNTLPTALNYPDGTGMAITYEGTPGSAGDYTGRVSKITLREGGTITYTYGGSNNGIDCVYQNAQALTRTLGNGDVTTYTLTHPQIGASANYQAVNTVVDPGGNQSIYTFTGFTSTGTSTANQQILTKVQHWQGSTTLLTTDLVSYNTAYTTTPSATTISQAILASGAAVTKKIVYHQISGMSTWSATEYHYDGYGNTTYVGNYGFGSSSADRSVTYNYGSCTAGCTTTSPTISNMSMAANNIYDRPGEILVTQGSSNVAQTNITYNATGNITSMQLWNGSSFIGQSTSNTINPNGTPSKTFDVANNETDYSYASGSYSDVNGCTSATQYPFPTQVKDAGTGDYTNYTYDCVGGVVLTSVDRNSATTTYTYVNQWNSTADPWWRLMDTTDPYSVGYLHHDVITSGVLTGSEDYVKFNSNNSVIDISHVIDGYSRLITTSKQTGPTTGVYDTVSDTYGWSGNYSQVKLSQPCTGTSCTTVHTSDYDPLGRLYTEATTSNETLTNTYTYNDVLSALTPTPTGETAGGKQVQTEYDGLGRVSKICHIGSTASTGSGTACSQASGSANGATDSYTYGQGTGYTTVAIARGSETRTFTYDALGRMTKKVTPEGGTWNYYYDSSSCTGGATYKGDLVCVSDPDGNNNIYFYDSLHRLTDVGGGASGATSCKRFRYDNSSGALGALPTGVTLTNQYGRMVEAETDDCTHYGTSFITDEWFAYDKDGRMLNYWQETPNSTQYYKSTATFAFGNATPDTVALTSPSLYTMTFALDGEGRVDYAKVGTTVMVNSETFNAASQPTAVALIGASSDNDAYTYDSNTGNMTGYTFTVGATPASLAGTVYWNGNGTLKELVTVDGFNAGGSSTCVSDSTGSVGYGYDDWTRLAEFDCGNPNWGQEFTYDIYDNLSKAPHGTGRTGTTWNPGYNATTFNNQFTGGTFDSNGNTKADGTGSNYWGWNEFNKMSWYRNSSIAPTCGTNGKCMTYDAFGRTVEESNGAVWKEIWYTQAGQVNMSGATANYAYWPISSAGTVVVSGNNTTVEYTHNDWLSNGRVTSGHNRAVTADQAVTPYGEIFNNFGSASSQYDIFAGTTSNFNNGIQWETPNRELAIFSRWLSPDSTQGGQWNTYAYPTNPNSFADPTGLGIARNGGCATFGQCINTGTNINEYIQMWGLEYATNYSGDGYIFNSVFASARAAAFALGLTTMTISGPNGDGSVGVINDNSFNNWLLQVIQQNNRGIVPPSQPKNAKPKNFPLGFTPEGAVLVPLFKGFSENPYAFVDTETGETIFVDSAVKSVEDASTSFLENLIKGDDSMIIKYLMGEASPPPGTGALAATYALYYAGWRVLNYTPPGGFPASNPINQFDNLGIDNLGRCGSTTGC